MAQSSILGGGKAPPTAPGHSTADLGPSDSSDSGSDLTGAPGRTEDTELIPDSGTTSDTEHGRGAGLDVGDANLDSDSDAAGTGERQAAGRDSSTREAGDIRPDQIARQPGGLVTGEDPEGIGVSRPPASRPKG